MSFPPVPSLCWELCTITPVILSILASGKTETSSDYAVNSSVSITIWSQSYPLGKFKIFLKIQLISHEFHFFDEHIFSKANKSATCWKPLNFLTCNLKSKFSGLPAFQSPETHRLKTKFHRLQAY